MTGIADLRTPAAVVDLDRLERSARWARDKAARLGVHLRPHVKTHKCIEIARLQHGGSTGPVAVSTLAEAAFFASAGFRDLTYAVPIAPQKLPAAAEIARSVDRLHLLVEHPETVAAVASFAAAHDVVLSLMIEVDCGGDRTGIDPSDPGWVDVAQAIHASPDLDLAGVLTHAGQAYRCRSRAEAAEVALVESATAAALADRLRTAGVGVPEVSVGSTPTFAAAAELSGVTEVRPGNYVLCDAFQWAIGSCAVDDIALSVVTRVISARRGTVVVDAGSLALSTDRGPVHVDPEWGYGVVCDLSGQPIENARLGSLSQEHGAIQWPSPVLPAPGDPLRILPNHSCLTAACHPTYHVARGEEIVDEWYPCRGW